MKLCWRPVKNGEINLETLYMPHRRRKPIDLLIDDIDLFACHPQFIDVVLAVVCSTGHTRFFYSTSQPKNRAAYFRDLKRRGKEAAKRYEAHMREHFRINKHEFLEGYSLPAPPTAEVRAIYDSAAAWEKRPHFSLGEYHWRSWPLSNLIDEVSDVPK